MVLLKNLEKNLEELCECFSWVSLLKDPFRWLLHWPKHLKLVIWLVLIDWVKDWSLFVWCLGRVSVSCRMVFFLKFFRLPRAMVLRDQALVALGLKDLLVWCWGKSDLTFPRVWSMMWGRRLIKWFLLLYVFMWLRFSWLLSNGALGPAPLGPCCCIGLVIPPCYILHMDEVTAQTKKNGNKEDFLGRVCQGSGWYDWYGFEQVGKKWSLLRPAR